MTFRNQVIQVHFTKVTEQNSPASYPTHTSKKKKCHFNFLSCKENTMNALHAIVAHFQDDVILEQYIRIGFLKNCKLALFLKSQCI